MTTIGRRGVLLGLTATAVIGGRGPSLAQGAYPAKPVRLVVPYPPGGGADSVARLVGQGLAERLGQSVVVENRAGAATNIGMDAVAKAAPDGYTLGLATSNLAINPGLYPSMPFDPATAFAPVSLLTKGLYVLVVNPAVPAASVAELTALAKAKPGTLNAAIAGLGTPGHLALAKYNVLTGADITPIPYQGAGPAITSVLGNQTQVLFISMASAIPHVRSGKLRLLAITSSGRSSQAPDAPTAIEAGLAGLEIYEWYGVLAPARTDPEIVARLSAEIGRVLGQPEIRDRTAALGADAAPNDPAAFAGFIKEQLESLGRIVRETGIKVE